MRRSWRRDDSLVVLSVYMARPPGRRLPPEAESQRAANLLHVPIERIRQRMVGFAVLDPGNPMTGEPPRSRADRALWRRYHDDAMRCHTDAEWVLEGRKWRPRWLYRD